MKKKIFLVGGGGHCLSVMDVCELQKEYQIEGVFDANLKVGTLIGNYPVLGPDSEIAAYIGNDHYFLVTIGQIKNASARKKAFDLIRSLGGQFGTVVSPLAHIAKGVSIGAGSSIHHFALLNTNSQVGENCIVNSRALVEHGAQIGPHCHLATGSIVNGDCKVGPYSFVGSGAILRQGLELGEGSFVQAGGFVNGI